MIDNFGHNRGYVRAEPIARLLREWIASDETNSISALSFRVHDQGGGLLYRIINGQRQWLHFDVADRIVVSVIGGSGWHDRDYLEEEYQKVNLLPLDIINPVSEKVGKRIVCELREAQAKVGQRRLSAATMVNRATLRRLLAA
jgi:hypothetical protein